MQYKKKEIHKIYKILFRWLKFTLGIKQMLDVALIWNF